MLWREEETGHMTMLHRNTFKVLHLVVTRESSGAFLESGKKFSEKLLIHTETRGRQLLIHEVLSGAVQTTDNRWQPFYLGRGKRPDGALN